MERQIFFVLQIPERYAEKMENVQPTHTDKTSGVRKLNFPKDYAGGRGMTSDS